MEVACSFLACHLQNHYKKVFLLCTATASVYLVKRYMEAKWQKAKNSKKDQKKIKEFPTVDQIQKFIENLPFEAVRSGKAVTLKDLLGELSEFSEDEDWKELIASVHTMYHGAEESPAGEEERCEDNVSIMSIYEDPNAINMGEETTPEVPNLPLGIPKTEENVFQALQLDLIGENQGKGDVEGGIIVKQKDEEELLENLLLGKQGEGDKESKCQL